MRSEVQLKIRGTLPSAEVISKGGAPLGETTQLDIYLAGRTVHRIRQDGESYYYSERGYEEGVFTRIHRALDSEISKEQAHTLMKEHGEVVRVEKTRKVFSFPLGTVCLDSVSGLGDFIEIRAESSEAVRILTEALGLDPRDGVREGYFDLMCRRNLSPVVSTLIRFHDRVRLFTFGITSAAMNSIGWLLGFLIAGTSGVAVAIAILVACGTDAFNDGASVFVERREYLSAHGALRSAVATYLGKVLFPLPFVVLLLLFPGHAGQLAAICYAVSMVLLIGAEQALVAHESVPARIKENLVLALTSAAYSVVLGILVGMLVGKG